MAVIQYDEYKQKLIALEPTLNDLEAALDLNGAREELMKLQAEAELIRQQKEAEGSTRRDGEYRTEECCI